MSIGPFPPFVSDALLDDERHPPMSRASTPEWSLSGGGASDSLWGHMMIDGGGAGLYAEPRRVGDIRRSLRTDPPPFMSPLPRIQPTPQGEVLQPEPALTETLAALPAIADDDFRDQAMADRRAALTMFFEQACGQLKRIADSRTQPSSSERPGWMSDWTVDAPLAGRMLAGVALCRDRIASIGLSLLEGLGREDTQARVCAWVDEPGAARAQALSALLCGAVLEVSITPKPSQAAPPGAFERLGEQCLLAKADERREVERLCGVLEGRWCGGLHPLAAVDGVARVLYAGSERSRLAPAHAMMLDKLQI